MDVVESENRWQISTGLSDQSKRIQFFRGGWIAYRTGKYSAAFLYLRMFRCLDVLEPFIEEVIPKERKDQYYDYSEVIEIDLILEEYFNAAW